MGGFVLPAYVAQPTGVAKGAIVVLQEIFGVNSHIQAVADAYAYAAQPRVAVHIYPVNHGFNCDRRGSYDAAAAKLALERTLAFFASHLV